MSPERHPLLLDEDDGTDERSPNTDLKINHAYVKRFTYNKQREALHRLQELEKRGLVAYSDEDGSSNDEDEDEHGLLPTGMDARIFETLTKIKKKDPSIYSHEIKFFDDVEQQKDGDEKEEGDIGNVKNKDAEIKKRPVYLKDALAKQLLEDGPVLDEKLSARKITMTYSKEQQELKNTFLQSVAEAELNVEKDVEEAGFLIIRKKSKGKLDKHICEDGQCTTEEVEGAVDDGGIMRRLEEYFGKDDGLDENDKFLKDFLLNQRWIHHNHDKIPSYDEIVGNISEDEWELERQEKFEAEYNFRFEEGIGSQVLGHSRFVEGSVRKKDDVRKKVREKKKEKVSQEAFERREELKRLKNVKKKEILQKLEKIRYVAGAKHDENMFGTLGEDDLDEDFDPDEYDRKMKEIFGDAYYQSEDADANFQGYEEDIEKLNFDVEDEGLCLPKEWNGPRKLGFAEARQKVKEAQKADDDSENVTEDEPFEDVMEQVEKKPKRKNGKISLREKLAFDKQLEEYYKLDYEDVIGDLPTRFRYRQVKPNMYGLNVSQVLSTDDKDLNQYVSLKKLAPYMTEEWVPKQYHRFSQKMRKKSALDLSPKKSRKVGIRNSSRTDETKHSESKDEISQQGSGEIRHSKNRKKKQKRSALKLSQSRLIAYGKISLSSKKRRKT